MCQLSLKENRRNEKELENVFFCIEGISMVSVLDIDSRLRLMEGLKINGCSLARISGDYSDVAGELRADVVLMIGKYLSTTLLLAFFPFYFTSSSLIIFSLVFSCTPVFN